MKMLYAGGECNNHCFEKYGGCEVHKIHQKTLLITEIALELGMACRRGEQVFLYTPDMFSDKYFTSVFELMPYSNGGFPKLYVAINSGVRSFIDRGITGEQLLNRGIQEIWFGIESASPRIRAKYGKPKFTNKEVLDITASLKEYGINVCWYLIDDREDNSSSRLLTYDLIKKGNPFRVRFARLTDEPLIGETTV